jgi:NAD(P)-dependent dehydrogenase (short-subunit alcohol dehydrogenase family)
VTTGIVTTGITDATGYLLAAGTDPDGPWAIVDGLVNERQVERVGRPVAGSPGVDLTRWETTRACLDGVVARRGDPAALIVLPPAARRLACASIDGQAWRYVLDGTLTAAMHVARAGLPHLLAGHGGPLVLVGWQPDPDGPDAAGAAASAALGGLARALAAEVAARGVRPNALLLPRQAPVAGQAGLRLLLAPDAPYIVGEVLTPRPIAGQA